MGIQGVGAGALGASMLRPVAPPAAEGTTSFKDVLFAKIDEVNGLQREAEAAMADLASGRARNVDDVMAAVHKAEIAYQTLLQIRNKLFEAYQEISQMRV